MSIRPVILTGLPSSGSTASPPVPAPVSIFIIVITITRHKHAIKSGRLIKFLSANVLRACTTEWTVSTIKGKAIHIRIYLRFQSRYIIQVSLKSGITKGSRHFAIDQDLYFIDIIQFYQRIHDSINCHFRRYVIYHRQKI